MRCLALAHRLAADGWSIAFATRAESLVIVPILGEQTNLLVLDADAGDDIASLRRRWPDGCNCLIVDHYGIDARFERSCREWAAYILIIDDLANRHHDCDALIDSTLDRSATDYAFLLPDGAQLFLGPDYALLRPEFSAEREVTLERRSRLSRVSRVLVSLGLTDIGGATARLIQPLLDAAPDLVFDVVLGSVASSCERLQALALRESRLVLHVDPTSIADLMSQADLAIGAAGTTSWERCCLGLPSLMLVLADNQRMVAARLEAAGAAVSLGADVTVDPNATAAALTRLAQAPAKLRFMSERAAAVCDGRGTARVVAAMAALSAGLPKR